MRHRTIRIISLLLVCLLLAGCGAAAPSAADSEPAADPETALYEALFDPANKVEIHIDMTEEEIAKIQQDYDYYSSNWSKSPIYRMADMKITVTTAEGTQTYEIPQVGVRMKGNTSRTDFYNEDEGVYNLIHFKVDFQETFDDPLYYGDDALEWEDAARKERRNRTFAALEKMELKWNKNDDSTYIREGYAYDIFRSFNVMAQRTNLASVDWAGEHLGVYTIYEPVDKAFLEKRLTEEQLGGDLYKCGWASVGADLTPTDSIGVEDEDKGWFFCYDLVTNKNTSNHESLHGLIDTLNAGNVQKEDIEAVVDMDSFLRFAAACYITGNPDDMRNDYNNTFIYFLADSGKAVFIPYDYDRCLGVNKDWDPSGNGMTLESPFDIMMMGTRHEQTNPLFLYTVCEGGYYIEEYAEILRGSFEKPLLTVEAFNERYRQAEQMYAEDTEPSREFYNAWNCNFRFDLYDTSHGNLTCSWYLYRKMDTLKRELDEAGLL